MNTYKIFFTRENGTTGTECIHAKSETQAVHDFYECYRHGTYTIAEVKLVCKHFSASEVQGRKVSSSKIGFCIGAPFAVLTECPKQLESRLGIFGATLCRNTLAPYVKMARPGFRSFPQRHFQPKRKCTGYLSPDLPRPERPPLHKRRRLFLPRTPGNYAWKLDARPRRSRMSVLLWSRSGLDGGA